MAVESHIELRKEPSFEPDGFVVVLSRNTIGEYSARAIRGYWLELPSTIELLASAPIRIPNNVGEATFALLPEALPASLKDSISVDGIAYTLTARMDSGSVVYKWWAEVPPPYALLKPLAEALEALV